MKILNFINPLPRHKQQAIHRWYTISCILSIITIGPIAFIQIQQLYAFFTQRTTTRHAQTKCAAISPLHAELKTLKEQEQNAHEKLMRIKKIQDNYKNIGQHMQSVLHICTQTAALQEYQVDEQHTTITLHTQSSQDTLKIVDALSKLPWFSNVQIASLQSTHHEKYPFLAVIKATMVS